MGFVDPAACSGEAPAPPLRAGHRRPGPPMRAVDNAVKVRDSLVSNLLSFLHSGRSGYVLLCGLALLVLAGVMLVATFDSREARAAPAGWELFVAATGSNQWMPC